MQPRVETTCKKYDFHSNGWTPVANLTSIYLSFASCIISPSILLAFGGTSDELMDSREVDQRLIQEYQEYQKYQDDEDKWVQRHNMSRAGMPETGMLGDKK